MDAVATRLPGDRRRAPVPRSDGRSREARIALETRSALVMQIGQPNATQELLIQAAVQLKLRLFEMETAFKRGEQTDNASYARLAESLASILKELGASV